MNINSIIFMPQLNANSISSAPFMASPPQHQHHLNAANVYQMRHMAGFQQSQRFIGPPHHQQHQHQAFSQSPPQRQGYAQYYQQNSTNRYFYNTTMITQRAPAPTNQANPTGSIAKANYRKSPINYIAQNPKAANATETTTEKMSHVTNEITAMSSEEQANKCSDSATSITPNTPSTPNTTLVATQQQCQLGTKKEQQIKKIEKLETIIKMKSTKCTKLMRSDSKTSLAAVVSSSTDLVALAADAIHIIETSKDAMSHQMPLKQDDTMQRNSSKASHSAAASSTSAKSHHHNHNKNHADSSDSGISGHHGPHQTTHPTATTAKQRKTRGSNKTRQDAAANAANTTNNQATAGGQRQKRSTAAPNGFTVNDWLQNDMFCYERRFISSCGEESRARRHNPAHRNSTSSDAAGSDDLNSSSSYEDHCPTYTLQTKTAKKSSNSRQRRQQKRKQLLANTSSSTATTNNSKNNSSIPATGTSSKHNVTNTNATEQQQPMDIDEDFKENRKPKQSSSTAALNLRKQCTKAAAIKAALNSSKLSKCQMNNVLSTSPSNSSVCSSLSSASSTTSINSSISSSASSSPNHSANSSPTASPTVSKRNAEHLKKAGQALVPPLRQFAKLNMNESQMAQQLRQFIIDPNLLQVYGFPVESVHHEGCIEIYKCLPKHLAEEAVTKDNQRHHHHFYGRKKINADGTKTNVINAYDGLPSSAQWLSNNALDSGNGSGDSSPRFTDSDSSDMAEDDMLAQEPVMAFYTPDGVYQIFSEYDNSEEKQCVRCHKMFQVNAKGEYQTFDACSYHWGKLSNVYNGKCYVNIHSCCQGEEFSEGCSQHTLHVWNGCVVGINGPYKDYVHTKRRTEGKKPKHPKIYAIDCEMSYTGLGLEVTKVTVVGYNGALVYEHFVQPQAAIVDYNTRFSGITEKDLSPKSNNAIKTFAQVQQDLLKLFDADTILIGHGLDNDLRVLRLVHKTIVDTSLVFSHSTGFPYRRSLKNLTKSYLKRDIQCSDMGHSSFEDSRACLELMMWKLRKDSHHWGSYQ